LARSTAPAMVAFRAGVSPPAVKMPIRFIVVAFVRVGSIGAFGVPFGKPT
jgi:hypothetical protein